MPKHAVNDTNTHATGANPINVTAEPANSRPENAITRRPKRSEKRPENVCVNALPNEFVAIAKEANRVPATELDMSPPVAKYAAANGIIDDCTPNTDQPIAQFETNAER